MGKWRPAEKSCLYVIPDIHGKLNELTLILKRILPLRRTNGYKDKIVFLGDYIDRNADSHRVIDLLVEIKKKYHDQVIMLRGNHEQLMLDGLKPGLQSNKYILWMKNGGDHTLYGYMKRAGSHETNPYAILRNRAIDFIPKLHLDFLNSLPYYHETEDYIFVHAGCDPLGNLSEQHPEVLVWDRSLFKKMHDSVGQEVEIPWDKTIVCGHNSYENSPLIHPKYMMLDMTSQFKLPILELNSMNGFIAKKGKKRLVRFDIDF